MDTTLLSSSFILLMKRLPLAERKAHSDSVMALCDHFKLDYSLLKDQRQASAAFSGKSLWKAKHEDLPRYKINVRGMEWTFTATLPEAAEFMRVSETSLRNRVARGKVFRKLMPVYERGTTEAQKRQLGDPHAMCEDIVSVEKLTEEEQAAELELFQKRHQLSKSDIQSAPPTHP